MKWFRAFSLIELIVGIVLIAIITGAVTIKPTSARQSIRREAERVATYISSLIQFADRYQNPFTLNFGNGSFVIDWAYRLKNGKFTQYFERSPKYKLSSNVQELKYSIKNNNFTQGATITVEQLSSDDIRDRSKYYVIIAVIGGRIRTSPKPPDN